MKFMSDAQIEPASKSVKEKAVEQAREKLSRYVNRAVEILEELAEGAENERVRLAAADSILDRAGVGKSTNTQVTVGSAAEHEAANREAADVVAALARNKAHTSPVQGVPLDTLIVLEGEPAS
jgi:predicted sugar kinase